MEPPQAKASTTSCDDCRVAGILPHGGAQHGEKMEAGEIHEKYGPLMRLRNMRTVARDLRKSPRRSSEFPGDSHVYSSLQAMILQVTKDIQGSRSMGAVDLYCFETCC